MFKKELILYILILYSTNAMCQCKIETSSYERLGVGNRGLISKIYDSVLKIDDDNYYVLFIDNYGDVNIHEEYLIKIDSNNIAEAWNIFPDEIKRHNNKQEIKFDHTLIPVNNSEKNIYYSECSNLISSHRTCFLIILNKSKKIYIEYEVLDGDIEHALKSNNYFYFLTYTYEFIKKVFNDSENLKHNILSN